MDCNDHTSREFFAKPGTSNRDQRENAEWPSECRSVILTHFLTVISRSQARRGPVSPPRGACWFPGTDRAGMREGSQFHAAKM